MRLPILGCITLVLAAFGIDGVTAVHAQGAVHASSPRIPISQEYLIGPADVLQVSVWKNDALSRTVPVRPDGMITLPLVNEVRAAGLTPMELRDIIKKDLGQYLPNPEVSVIVMEMHSFNVSVLGQVQKAGRYQFSGPVTVLDALAEAGGITEFASPSDMYVLRHVGGTVKRISFNYSKVVASPDQNSNFSVQPGDILVVP
jgi:polysaccharide export outer membrane protein